LAEQLQMEQKKKQMSKSARFFPTTLIESDDRYLKEAKDMDLPSPSSDCKLDKIME